MKSSLFIVFLRRPGKGDQRSDPFWEFGSFGCTGCHRANLLSPKVRHVDKGDRLAFVQGGSQGCKLLLITPPVKRVAYGTKGVELRWSKPPKPFRYASKHAPVLAEPRAVNVKLRRFGKSVNDADRTSAQAKLASRFRSCCEPVEKGAAKELTLLFKRAKQVAGSEDFIKSYADARPQPPAQVLSLSERKRKYDDLVSSLRRRSSAPTCRRNSPRSCRRRR